VTKFNSKVNITNSTTIVAGSVHVYEADVYIHNTSIMEVDAGAAVAFHGLVHIEGTLYNTPKGSVAVLNHKVAANACSGATATGTIVNEGSLSGSGTLGASLVAAGGILDISGLVLCGSFDTRAIAKKKRSLAISSHSPSCSQFDLRCSFGLADAEYVASSGHQPCLTAASWPHGQGTSRFRRLSLNFYMPVSSGNMYPVVLVKEQKTPPNWAPSCIQVNMKMEEAVWVGSFDWSKDVPDLIGASIEEDDKPPSEWKGLATVSRKCNIHWFQTYCGPNGLCSAQNSETCTCSCVCVGGYTGNQCEKLPTWQLVTTIAGGLVSFITDDAHVFSVYLILHFVCRLD
jgi:hypothetical protein